MALALRELQAAFAAHLLGADRSDLVEAVTGDAIPAAARLDVYRHHVFESLGKALAPTFPTVQSVVGPDFFRRLARDFVAHALPAQPVLTEYGAELPAFIADYAPAHGLPYLADVARLDWALNLAFHAPAGKPLTAADLAAVPVQQLPAMSVVMPAGTRLIDSPYPLDRIWQASQPDAGDATVDLSSGGCQLLVLRRADDAGFVGLNAGEARFVAALLDGATLEMAANA